MDTLSDHVFTPRDFLTFETLRNIIWYQITMPMAIAGLAVIALHFGYFLWTVFISSLLDFVRRISNTAFLVFKYCFESDEGWLETTMKILSANTSTPYDLKLGLLKMAVIPNPDNIQRILNSSQTLGKSRQYNAMRDVFGEGLLTAPVPKWKEHRRLISPVFNSPSLKTFFRTFNRRNGQLIEELREVADTGREIDLWNHLAPMNFDITCGTMMNSFQENNLSANDKKTEFLRCYLRSMDMTSYMMRSLWGYNSVISRIYATVKGIHKDVAVMKSVIMEVIHTRRREIKAKQTNTFEQFASECLDDDGGRTVTFLDKLLKLNEQGAQFTDKDLQDEVLTMVMAGFNSSATTNCFILLMLAMHPHIQEKVYGEIVEVLGREDDGLFVQMDHVQRMPFLEQCIQETLRLFPVAPYIVRAADDFLELSNDFVVQPGDSVLVPIFIVHRNPSIYKNPEVWNPDNFAPVEVENRHKLSFLGFSSGPRGCIGSKYAMLSMKLTISLILKHYHLTTNVRLDGIRLKANTILRSSDGYKVMLRKR